MSRIFAALILSELLLLGGCAVFGAVDVYPTSAAHVVLAVFALMVSCLTQIVLFTYLTVTGKLVAQAAHLAGLDPEALVGVRMRKKAATHWLGLVVLSIFVVTATGAIHWQSENYLWYHTAAAFFVLAVHGFALRGEYRVVGANRLDTDRILREYERIRSQRFGSSSSESNQSS